MGDTFLICSSFVLKSIVDYRYWVAAWLVHSLIQQYLLFPSSLMIHYKWITGKDLLHSTGNSAQCYEATHPNGKRIRERIHTGTWITKSFCCTLETNKTLFMNYAPVHKIKGFKKSMKTKKLQTAVICVLMLLCVPLCDPMDYSPPGSSVHGILQARILEWVAISSSRASSRPRGQTHVLRVSGIGRWVLYHQVTWGVPRWCTLCYLFLVGT